MYAVSIVLITIWLVTASSDFIYFKMNTFYIKAHQLNLLHVVILVLLYLIVQIFLTYSRDICNWHWGQVSEALQTFRIPMISACNLWIHVFYIMKRRCPGHG